MLAYPLRDIGRSAHHALLQRKIRGKRHMSFLAVGRRKYGTHRNNQVYRIHVDNPLAYSCDR
jgi:hypothetical protein